MAFVRDMSGLNRDVTLDKKSMNALIRSLDALPKELRKAAERSVLRTGANLILKSAKSKVPVRAKGGGTLKKSLAVSVSSYKGMLSATVGPKALNYRNNNKTGRRGKYAGKAINTQEVAFYIETGTPRMAAQPFIRPAIEEAAPHVLAAMADGMDKHLTRVASRLAKK